MSTWRSIEEADKYEPAGGYLLYDPDIRDEDFNPSGVVDGHWQDGFGWQGAVWNNYQDCFDLLPIHPTHFMEKRGPVA